MALGIYLTSVFCTICSTEIRTGGGCKNQKSKMMHNEQAATWIKDTLWGFLFADPRGTDINRAFCCSASSKKRAGHKTWQETSQACKYEPDLPGVIGPAVSRQNSFQFIVKIQKPQTTFLTTLGNQRAWNLLFADEACSCDLQLQAPTPHSQVAKTSREKERLGRANSGPSSSFLSRDGHILVQRTLRHSRILLFGQKKSFQHEQSESTMPKSFEIIHEKTGSQDQRSN